MTLQSRDYSGTALQRQRSRANVIAIGIDVSSVGGGPNSLITLNGMNHESDRLLCAKGNLVWLDRRPT